MQSEDLVPKRAMRWLGISAAAVLVAIAVSIALISAGAFDPRPYGKLAESFGIDQSLLVSQSQQIEWFDQSIPSGSYTIRLSANLAAGDLDTGYGLLLGNEDEYVGVAVSSLGYVTMWQSAPATGDTAQPINILPWQTWPHVHPSQENNEIWIDVRDEKISSVRLNREILWQGSVPLNDKKYGIWAEGFAGPATIDFSLLELFFD
jgi:hypothetical protein